MPAFQFGIAEIHQNQIHLLHESYTLVKMSLCGAHHKSALAKWNSHREAPSEIKGGNWGLKSMAGDSPSLQNKVWAICDDSDNPGLQQR